MTSLLRIVGILDRSVYDILRSIMSTSRRRLLQSAALGALPIKVNAARRNVYEELGIVPVLNFRGTHTVIGASKVWPELHDAMATASQSFVSIEELQDK